MSQTAIPYLLMRGGTSRGPYFNRQFLPEDQAQLTKILLAVIGSGHPLNIDGIGGGAAVTTKVAMLSHSKNSDSDIDYFFAQVSVEDRLVDFKPTCGNILSGVAPAAIEMGLITPTQDQTEVRINAVNTGAKIIANVQTPKGQLTYDGNCKIAGVPDQAAPITLNFMDVVGSAMGGFLPSGKPKDLIDGIEVTCMDVAMPLVIARAEAFGLTGYESAQALDDNQPFFKKMEAIRRKAGLLMGMGDVAQSVTPKFGLLAPAREGGSAAARYFMPWKTHPSMAVTGAQCLAACLLTPETISEGLFPPTEQSPIPITLEHASGKIEVMISFTRENGFSLTSAGLVRTARKIADGHVYIPKSVWTP